MNHCHIGYNYKSISILKSKLKLRKIAEQKEKVMYSENKSNKIDNIQGKNSRILCTHGK